MSAGDDTGTPAGGRRLVAFYLVLAALTVAAVALVIAAGADEEPQPEIAGGYHAATPACLGQEFDVKQSGQFVSLDGAGELGGALRFEQGKLTGDVTCVDGRRTDLRARVGGGRILGRIGDAPVRASLVRDPPAPGAQKPRVPTGIAGDYKLAPDSLCLGSQVAVEGDAPSYEIKAGERVAGKATYRDGLLAGEVTCKSGATAELEAQAQNRELHLTIDPQTGPPERLTATKQREFPKTLAAFFVAVAFVMLAARLAGAAAVKLGQPRVMGEVVAGILLGPTFFGALAPELQAAIFPTDVIPLIGVVANLGLIFYMFLVGLELDPEQLRGRVAQAAAISNASVALPMVLGLAVALPLYKLVSPDDDFLPFAIYMGVAMSITAFPVLARILVERRMLKRPVGGLALACAAIDDVTAWFLIAVAAAVATAGSATDVIVTVALAIAFCLVMALVGRPLLARVSTAYDEAGRVPGGWIAAIFAGVLLSAYTTETIGIALIFGAFVMGLIMPRRAELTEDVTGRIEDFVVTLLLPLFFAFTGLRTNVGLLDRPELWAHHVAADRCRDRRQVHRGDGGRPPDWVRLASGGRDRDADEHARANGAHRSQPGPGGRRDLGRPVRDAGDHGAGDDLHGRAAAHAARSPQRVRRDRRRRSSTGHAWSPRPSSPRWSCRSGRSWWPPTRTGASSSCSRWPGRWRARSLPAS